MDVIPTRQPDQFIADLCDIVRNHTSHCDFEAAFTQPGFDRRPGFVHACAGKSRIADRQDRRVNHHRPFPISYLLAISELPISWKMPDPDVVAQTLVSAASR